LEHKVDIAENLCLSKKGQTVGLPLDSYNIEEIQKMERSAIFQKEDLL
jgi:hypothetical protein